MGKLWTQMLDNLSFIGISGLIIVALALAAKLSE